MSPFASPPDCGPRGCFPTTTEPISLPFVGELSFTSIPYDTAQALAFWLPLVGLVFALAALTLAIYTTTWRRRDCDGHCNPVMHAAVHRGTKPLRDCGTR